jgi:hypothetical protein
MRTIIVILGGLVLLGLSALVASRSGTGGSMVMVAQLLIPVWLAAALINMWIGVTRAGFRWPRSFLSFLPYSPFPRLSQGSSGGNFRENDATGRPFGGHVAYGCTIRTTAEALLLLLPEWSFMRELDSATGFAELVIRARSYADGSTAAPRHWPLGASRLCPLALPIP